MLAEGRQTVLPPTIHPDLKAPYRWGNGATPYNTELKDIAVLRPDWEERVEAVLAKHGYEPEPPKSEQRTFDETSPFFQINRQCGTRACRFRKPFPHQFVEMPSALAFARLVREVRTSQPANVGVTRTSNKIC